MSAVYQVPGVYIEEPFSLALSIQSGDTAIPVFVGHFAPKKGAPPEFPLRIESWFAFTQQFLSSDTVHIEMNPEKGNGEPTVKKASHTSYIGSYSVRAYFDNGGGPCYILDVGDVNDPSKLTAKIATQPEITLLCWCEHESDNVETAITTALSSLLASDRWGNRGYFLLTDAALETGQNFSVKTSEGVSYPQQTAAYFPAVETTYTYSPADERIFVSGISDKTVWGDTLPATVADVVNLLASTKPTGDKQKLEKQQQTLDVLRKWLAEKVQNRSVIVRGSCAMAGVIARTDRERGVWKAPANVALASTKTLVAFDTKGNHVSDYRIDDSKNSTLLDQRVNALRLIRGQGAMVWGARTMASVSDTNWKYIPVRRLFNAVERDLQSALKQAVFEPNSEPTWEQIRSAIDHYLYALWRKGALMGKSPDEAYFVQIGLGTSMDEQDILDGRMILRVGLAAVRPVEFIILQLAQQMQSA
ncbi:phage tail sheath family protein [Burkholderia cenocepacia]|uniref:phage tail sheath family protein n=1 Tax=Burkholderia cenocepacia TaxID=95486 RepID=UPI000F5A1B39|nr:phage tail sheath C-terminal domain-containing protein [Burkholderia cenocepacia]RQU52946.1 phage tail sheath family protein [Burkholderia cenocepacia]RQV35069.1 phage tail sheath family protein [Burkholderia cenocepacia]